jgi:hypothetical protein
LSVQAPASKINLSTSAAGKAKINLSTSSAGKTQIKNLTTTSTKLNPAKMRYDDAMKYLLDNPSLPPVPPEGYSRQATKNFLAELARRRLGED